MVNVATLVLALAGRRLTLTLGLCAIALATASLALGPVPLAPWTTARALMGYGDPIDVLIVQELRLPRTLLAVMIGASLALAGAALQGLLRNPLASPDVLGAPGAAAFGAVLAISLGLTNALSFGVPLAAVAMALASILVLLALAGPRANLLTLLLAGLALSSFAAAAISLTLNLAPNPFAALEIAFWLLGSLEDRSFRHIVIALPFMLAGGAVLMATRGQLRGLTLGEDVARSSGLDLQRLQILTLTGVACAVGSAVAVAGLIGFIGLITPHLVRPLVGNDPARVHVPAMLAGASLLLAADIVSRLLAPAGEIRVGVLTALVGVPFFIWLVLERRRTDLLQSAGVE
jgi:iron complex transport system permease protein